MNLDSDLVNVLGMHTCTRVHDKLSCTRLQNHTIMYTNMVEVTKFIAKNNKTTHPVKQRYIWRLNAKLSNNLRRMNFTEDSLADVTGGYTAITGT